MTGWPCHRCGTDSVLAVLRVPHAWTNAAGHRVPVISELHLCARCDAGLDRDDTAACAEALLRWIQRARPPVPDQHAFTADLGAWRRGDL